MFLVKEATLQIDELRLTVVECLSYPEQIYVDLVLNQDHFQFIQFHENFIVRDLSPTQEHTRHRKITAQHRSGSHDGAIRIVYESFFQPGAIQNFDLWRLATVSQLLIFRSSEVDDF